MTGQGLTVNFDCFGNKSGLPCTVGVSYAKSMENIFPSSLKPVDQKACPYYRRRAAGPRAGTRFGVRSVLSV